MSRRTVALALGLALVLTALAGCSLPTQSDDGEATVTPAAVPGVDERGVEEGEVTLPGVYDGTVISAAELADAHNAALGNGTYRVRESLNWSSRGAERRDLRAALTASTWYRNRTVVRHDRQRLRTFLSDPVRPEWTNTSTYRLGDERAVRTARNGTVAYDVVPANTTSGRIRDNTTVTVRQLLAVRNATLEPIEWRGEEHVLLVGRDPRHDLFSLVDDYRVRAIVHPDGLVRRLSVSYSQSGLGRQRTTAYAVAVDPIPPGRIDRPAWVGTALNRTTPAP